MVVSMDFPLLERHGGDGGGGRCQDAKDRSPAHAAGAALACVCR